MSVLVSILGPEGEALVEYFIHAHSSGWALDPAWRQPRDASWSTQSHVHVQDQKAMEQELRVQFIISFLFFGIPNITASFSCGITNAVQAGLGPCG